MSVLYDNFTIEKIKGKKRKEDGRIYYLIKWHGFPKDEQTWELENELIGDGHKPELDAYNKNHQSITSRPHGPSTPKSKRAVKRDKPAGKQVKPVKRASTLEERIKTRQREVQSDRTTLDKPAVKRVKPAIKRDKPVKRPVERPVKRPSTLEERINARRRKVQSDRTTLIF